MTLFVPDLSHHQAGIDLHALKREGSAAIIARVGQGAGRRSNGQNYGTTRDREWVRHRDEARRVGLPLVAYWYVGNLLTADEQAGLAAAWVGDTGIPWMIDHEDASGSIAHYHETVRAFRRRGLRVILGYVPRWYWSSQGSPSLAAGPPLVNSRYSSATGTPSQIYAAAGGDKGNGWESYGGQQVALWQFTNKASMAGMAIDCSAWRGTSTELLNLINGTQEKASMDKLIIARQPSTNTTHLGDGITRRKLISQTTNDLRYTLNRLGLSAQLVEGGDIENLDVLGADIAAAVAMLADDEANIIGAVRTIVETDADATLEISDEQVQRLADAVTLAVPPHVREAVREAFARAGGVEPGAFPLPDLIGMTRDQVVTALQYHAWNGQLIERTGVTIDPSALNTVVDQHPSAGTQINGSTAVTITVAAELAASRESS